jgi:hypothetical protein
MERYRALRCCRQRGACRLVQRLINPIAALRESSALIQSPDRALSRIYLSLMEPMASMLRPIGNLRHRSCRHQRMP